MTYFVYHFQVFLLILMRMGGMIFIAPFFSSALIPMRIKALLAFLITLVIFPVVAAKGYEVPGGMGEYALVAINEITIGLFIGFLVAIIFAAFQLAAQFFAVQIGFGINEVLDPFAEVSIPLLGQLQNLIALLLFMAINGHHFMIMAIYRSYELAPLFGISGAAAKGFLGFLMHSFSGMFIIALKIALPVLATVFLVTVSMGILAKAAPQMNIMMLGFPFQIVVAFAVLILTTPLIIKIMNVSMERTFGFVSKVILRWPG